MAEDGKIIYKVTLDDSGVESESEAAGRKAGDGVERGAHRGTGAFQEAMIGAARRIGEAFVEMAEKAVRGVEQIVQAGVEFNAKMEKYQTGLTTLLGTEQEAAAVMAQIRSDAARTPFDVDSLTQANQMLISTGMSASDARNDVLNLANAIAATGGGSAELSRMAANMQQVKNVGKATAMDIRQFAMAGINIYGLLADATGKTTEEVKDMEVSYELLSYALEKAAASGGKYEGAMEAQSQTFNGRLSTLKDNILQLEGALTQDIFAQLSDTALPMVMDWVAQLLEAAQTGGVEGAIQVAGQILKSLLDRFLQELPNLIDTGLTLLEGMLSGLIQAIPKIIPVVLQIIQTFVNGLTNHLPQLISLGITLLITLIEGLVQALPQLISMLPEIITTIVNVLMEHLPEIISAAGRIIVAIISGLTQTLPQLIAMLPQIIYAIMNAFFSADWASIGGNIVQGVWNGIKSLWHSLVEAVTNMVSELWSSAKNALGIASPSKKFKYIGEMSVEGMEEGFEEGETDLEQTVHHVYDTMLGAAGGGAAGSRGAMEQSVSYSLTATGRTPDQTIVVPLYLDGREIARATAWNMGEQLAWEEL